MIVYINVFYYIIYNQFDKLNNHYYYSYSHLYSVTRGKGRSPEGKVKKAQLVDCRGQSASYIYCRASESTERAREASRVLPKLPGSPATHPPVEHVQCSTALRRIRKKGTY